MYTSVQKVCPPGKILNPRSNRCVNKDGKIGLSLKYKSVNVPVNVPVKVPVNVPVNKVYPSVQKECPPDKILNPRSNRCVNKDGKIGLSLRGISPNVPINKPIIVPINNPIKDPINNYDDVPINIAIDDCSSLLNNKLHQCECPICWIVSSITALKFSNLQYKILPIYRKIINDAYDVFTDLSVNDEESCPYIPVSVIKRYKIYDELYTRKKIDESSIFSDGGFPDIFILSLLKEGLQPGYDIDIAFDTLDSKIKSPNNIYILSMFGFEPISIDERSQNLIDRFNDHRRKFIKDKYDFSSGIVVFKNFNETHAIAFSRCEDKYYLCNSHKKKCMPISDSRFSSIYSQYGQITMLFYILVPT